MAPIWTILRLFSQLSQVKIDGQILKKVVLELVKCSFSVKALWITEKLLPVFLNATFEFILSN